MAVQYVEARVAAKHHTMHRADTTKNVWSKMSVVQILRISGLVNMFFSHLYQEGRQSSSHSMVWERIYNYSPTPTVPSTVII